MRLSTFNGEKPESYPTWKASFCSIIRELETNALETLELLIKHLSEVPKSMAEAIKNAHCGYPNEALQAIWKSLDGRYGHPQILEASINKKVLSLKPYRKSEDLYDVITLLIEINAAIKKAVPCSPVVVL